jgi:regulator of nonsense transcripts 2
MALPSTSFFAVHTIANQQAEQEERLRLKHLVLGYQERERAAAQQRDW